MVKKDIDSTKYFSSSLVRASDRNSEDPGSNPGWIYTSFFHHIHKMFSPRFDSLYERDLKWTGFGSTYKRSTVKPPDHC